MSDTFEVHLDPCTINSRKVLAGLDLMGVKYKFNHIDYFTGQQKSPEFTKINPHQTVPAATDGDLVLTESNAILAYGADKDGGHNAYPKDPKQRALVNKWLLWEASVWFQACYIPLIENVVKPLLGAEPDQSKVDGDADNWNKNAKILDDQLGKTKWLVGDNVTIADIAVASPMHLWEASKLPLDKYPNLKRWMTQQVEQLPEWQKTQVAVEKALLPNKAATNGTSDAVPSEVRSTFNYTKDVSPQLTELYFYEDEKANHIHEPGDDPHEMTVKNGWNRAKDFDVDKHGFSVQDFNPSYKEDWSNEEAVKDKFYPEVVDFLKKTVGASRVLVFDHTIRTKGNQAKKLTQETNTSQRAPVMLVHCDYTAESGPLRVQQLLGSEAEELLKRRVAFINVWKPLNKVEERPLAMCDVTSAPSDDFFKLYLRYRERTGENYVMRHSDRHQWYYFPDMTPDKVILLKTYDSDTGRAQFVGHSAFEDPTSKPDAPFRESVEIRTIAFF